MAAGERAGAAAGGLAGQAPRGDTHGKASFASSTKRASYLCRDGLASSHAPARRRPPMPALLRRLPVIAALLALPGIASLAMPGAALADPAAGAACAAKLPPDAAMIYRATAP